MFFELIAGVFCDCQSTWLHLVTAFQHHITTIEEQKELFDKYTKRLQVVRETKERQSVEYQGM